MHSNRKTAIVARILRALGFFYAVYVSCLPSATAQTAAAAPTQVKIAAVLGSGPDDPWNATLISTWKEMRAAKPHGLAINDPVYTENVFGSAAEAALRLYARKGYDIIWAHANYTDEVRRIHAQYPNTLFVLTGAPNQPIGGNVYVLYNRIHEPAYLAGIAAGILTRTGVVGAVAGFPTEDTNDAINAFFAGAKSVRPEVKQKVSFIASWWDPPMANEAMKAQVASGVDQEFMLSSTFDVCKQQKVTCYGAYRDWNTVAPQNIATSALGNWTPGFKWILDEWQASRSNGQPFAGNMNKRYFGMAEGGAQLAPFHDFPMPPAVAARVNEARTRIEARQLTVELDVSKPASSK